MSSAPALTTPADIAALLRRLRLDAFMRKFGETIDLRSEHTPPILARAIAALGER